MGTIEQCQEEYEQETKEKTSLSAVASNDRVRWEIGDPPADILLEVRCSDCMGDWYGVAMRKDYKKPPKGKSKKGFRKRKWRWLNSRGDVFEGVVEAWRTRST